MLCCGCTWTEFMGLCSLCGCSVESYFLEACLTCSCTTKGHPGSLSFKQGQYIHGNLTKVPFDECLLVTVVTMLKSSSGDTQHFVESLSFLWPQILLYIAVFVHYSFRCLHGESRYTTDSTRVGVTLDYVVVSNHSLTQTISYCLYFLRVAMVHWCSFWLYDLVLPSLQCQL